MSIDTILDAAIAQGIPVSKDVHRQHRLVEPMFRFRGHRGIRKICADLENGVDIVAVDFAQCLAQLWRLNLGDGKR